MILCAKYALHQTLNRQSDGDAYAREGIDLPLSTLADDVGACAAVLLPFADLIRAHVFRAARVHGDETPVPLLAKGKTIKARLWSYVRDDKPFDGQDPPAAVCFFSRDRAGEHPERHLAHYSGILQADAYAGFGGLYQEDRAPCPIVEALCWSHDPEQRCRVIRQAPLFQWIRCLSDFG
jgi:transposase